MSHSEITVEVCYNLRSEMLHELLHVDNCDLAQTKLREFSSGGWEVRVGGCGGSSGWSMRCSLIRQFQMMELRSLGIASLTVFSRGTFFATSAELSMSIDRIAKSARPNRKTQGRMLADLWKATSESNPGIYNYSSTSQPNKFTGYLNP